MNADKFISSTAFIIAFVILVLILSMTISEKAVEAFLALVLLSMVVLNAGKVTTLLKFK